MGIKIANWHEAFEAIDVKKADNVIDVRTDLDIDLLTNNNKGRRRTVGKLGRKARNKHYTSPRIVLGQESKDLIGKHYVLLKGKATIRKLVEGKEESRTEGDCVVLFFSEEDPLELV